MKNVLLLLAILIASALPAAAQSAADGLDTTLVAYYRWCNRHKQDPEMLLKADTMFRLAGERQNPRMQSVALCLKTDYYYYTGNLDSLKVWVARTQQFTREHDQLTHYYFVWTRLITYYSKYSKYTLAQYELERFRDQAIRDDYKPAIAEAYKQLGHIYRTKSLYDTAIESYAKSIGMVERNNLKEVDASYLYLQLAELYTLQQKYDKAEEALRMSEKRILHPEHIWRTRISRANLAAMQGDFESAEEQVREIREKSGGYVSENKIEEIELTIYKGTRNFQKALEIVNKQLANYEMTKDSLGSSHYFYIPMLASRASLLYETGSYKAAAEDLSRQAALARQKYESDNQEMLNEFATLFDVERHHREKVEARQQAQAERLRRARLFETGLGVILLLATAFIVILTRLNRGLARAKRAAEESSRMKGVFIRNITHEINTPLNAIVGFSNLLAETDDIGERREYMRVVEENNELLLKLISDILDLSKIEAGTFEFNYGRVDVNRMCEETVCSLSLKVKDKPVELIFGEHDAQCCVVGDKNRLIQVITNFINNAVKFTDEGSITLGYRTEGGELLFHVEDTGSGISEEHRQSIFDRFVKLNSFAQGTGLGLSISKSIVEQMGGRIGVESEVGRGSRFWFTIPAVTCDAPEKKGAAPAPRPAAVHGDGRLPRLLVAEDTDSNYLLVSLMLRREFDIVRASDGEEAVRICRELKPAAILMDVKMPGMDGLEATRRIRAFDPSVPIVAVTAFAYDRDRQKALDAGASEYLSKPLNGERLRQTLRELLSEE